MLYFMHMKLNKTLCFARWIPAMLIIAASWHISSKPTVPLPNFQHADKAVHCVCFAALSFWIAFACGTRKSAPIRLTLPIFFTSLYGIVDEVHQHFTPGRTCSVFDWLFDTVGAVLGSIAFYIFCIFLIRLKTNSRQHKE